MPARRRTPSATMASVRRFTRSRVTQTEAANEWSRVGAVAPRPSAPRVDSGPSPRCRGISQHLTGTAIRGPGTPLRETRTTADRADAGRFPLFAATWALAALFHTEYHGLAYREAALTPKLTALLVTGAAVSTLWRPSVGALTALAVAELLDVAVLLPEVPNHWLLAGLVSLAWVLGRIGAGPGDGEALLARVRPPLLVAVALFYFWTGFWKLNVDFLRPEISCAIASWERVLALFAWLPDGGALRHGVIWATLAMELMAPLLLLAPRARRVAVPLFILFHLGLGLDVQKRYLNFSSVMFALLLLYLPQGAMGRLHDLFADRAAAFRRTFTLVYLALIAASLIAGMNSPLYWIGRWLLWLPYAVGLLIAVVLACALAPRDPRTETIGAGAGLAWAVPVLVMLNGLCPILGLKTRTSWQMYSNIRLEADASNHLLVPRSLDLLGALRDRVVIINTTDEKTNDLVTKGLDLPWIEFRRRMREQPEAAVTYERGGERRVVARVADDAVLSRPLPILARKLAFFRPLGPVVAERCEW
jgi:hypothetical protein